MTATTNRLSVSGKTDVPRHGPQRGLGSSPTVPSNVLKTCSARTLEEWRMWLADHHASDSEVWLVFHKRHTGQACIAYADAVDEALCFGWVDSLIKRLDEERYARKFTPRNTGSRWSATNRTRYARLKASGRLTPAGLERPPTNRGYETLGPSSSKVPQYIENALDASPAARSAFERLAPSHRQRYVGWIDSAKQDATKIRRLEEAVRLLASGKTLGLK